MYCTLFWWRLSGLATHCIIWHFIMHIIWRYKGQIKIDALSFITFEIWLLNFNLNYADKIWILYLENIIYSFISTPCKTQFQWVTILFNNEACLSLVFSLRLFSEICLLASLIKYTMIGIYVNISRVSSLSTHCILFELMIFWIAEVFHSYTS